MKKTFVLSVLALITFFAKGQTAKSDWLAGGAIGFTSATQKESDISGSAKTTVFLLTPDIGYFFIDNLAAGIGLNLTSTHLSNSGPYGTSSSTLVYFTAGPFARYYFNTSPHVKLFLHGDASWGNEKYNFSSGGPNQSVPAFPISIYEGKAGAAYFLNQNLALEFTAGYQSMIQKDKTGGTTIKYTTGSILIGLGFQVYLGPVKR
ncbi:MAG TPA: outer membrane beta-barrel protein [Puia sp.]|jgi:hypothetical protein|nr:outer membrane beta-barrel protein [Puia sp.]